MSHGRAEARRREEDKTRSTAAITGNRRKYMTTLEVAEYLGIGRSSVYDLIASGGLEAKRFGPRKVRVHVEEVERFEKESAWKPLGG